MNKIIGIIPARYASTRFPGKPLIDIGGKTMIQRTWEQAKKAKYLDEVYVATDSTIINDHVLALGGKCIITSDKHVTGTDRCAEVANKIAGAAYINIQGDEPFIQPAMIDQLALYLKQSDDAMAIATLIKPIMAKGDLDASNLVKVVIDCNNLALYFSRFPIPFVRQETNNTTTFYKHIGMYGYTAQALKLISTLVPTPLELAESLEQLRWLENGLKITCINTDLETISIDIPSDLDKIKDYLR
jgi:3-deoxy-manno-octulosonate cytidylyltransferase (CMP-KDO synthetase)